VTIGVVIMMVGHAAMVFDKAFCSRRYPHVSDPAPQSHRA
jgi:hypothetical protein